MSKDGIKLGRRSKKFKQNLKSVVKVVVAAEGEGVERGLSSSSGLVDIHRLNKKVKKIVAIGVVNQVRKYLIFGMKFISYTF